MSIHYYQQNAEVLAKQYLSKEFSDIHSVWQHLIPLLKPNSRILDIGAGAGRDSLYLAALDGDHQIVAVEPAQASTQAR